jgi:hypothetical protein
MIFMGRFPSDDPCVCEFKPGRQRRYDARRVVHRAMGGAHCGRFRLGAVVDDRFPTKSIAVGPDLGLR